MGFGKGWWPVGSPVQASPPSKWYPLTLLFQRRTLGAQRGLFHSQAQ